MSARDSYPMVSDPEQLKEMDWSVFDAEHDSTDHELSFNITRAFEEQNQVILDDKALLAFRVQMQERLTAK